MSKSPKEVIDDIIYDWKALGYSFEDASRELGYSSKQTLSTLLYRLKRNNEYFSLKQAARFGNAFNYDPEFLMSGEGELHNKTKPGDNNIDYLKFKELKLSAMVQVATTLITFSHDKHLNDAWTAIVKNDEDGYLASLCSFASEKGLYLLPGQINHLIAHIACLKSTDDLIKEFGRLDATLVLGAKFDWESEN